ncbi:MAG: gluconokinase [Actinomycetota bacterium]|nr:gluconokinase [Actinomycetota bacterium]
MSSGTPRHLVVMGVSGVGKTTIAEAVAGRLGWELAEGDDFHSAANRAKMSAGLPLTDADRLPWLRALVAWTAARRRAGRPTVLTCSALKRRYRDILRQGGDGEGTAFVHLVADRGLLLQRMRGREHFMPADLLQSQLDDLEPLQHDEPGVVVDAALTPERIVAKVVAELGLRVTGR